MKEKPMKRFTRILSLAGVVASSLALGVVVPEVAEASCVSNFPWSSQTEMVNYPGSPGLGCQRNFVTDPGFGELLNPNTTSGTDALLRPDRVAFYQSQGFSENFLWYAPRTTTQTSPADTRTWSACTTGIPQGTICPTLKVGSMGPDFTQTVTLDIIGDDNVFIALACGNYTSNTPGQVNPPAPKPVPFIDGHKFRDDDRDGTRDAGEPTLSNWDVKVTRVSSSIGQSTGVVANLTTNAGGYYKFNLDGHGPGRYKVEEILQSGWQNYTPISYTVDVGFGVGSQGYGQDFGNAQTTADVAKTAFSVSNVPVNLDVNTATDVDVSVTIENFGPAGQVPVSDEILAILPADCTTPNPRRTLTAVAHRGQPITETFTFSITCSRPSFHDFVFDDTLTITRNDITDTNPANNTRSTGFTSPVHAETDLAVDATLSCDPTTNVGDTFGCSSDVTVTNNGFGPIDATVEATLAVPDDCQASLTPAVIALADLEDLATKTQTVNFDVVCDHRSFHEFSVSTSVSADDIHVFDTNPANDSATAGPETTEVFHDAALAADNVHLTCNEAIGSGDPFTCTATLDISKMGPAPDVDVIAYVELGLSPECTTVEGRFQDVNLILSSSDVLVYTWTVTCPADPTLHPFDVTADVNPNPTTEPHAVDLPGPITDTYIVPTCLPTVNPHGNNEPSAPGNGNQGQNQDGFYVFGTIPLTQGVDVSIRDDESGVVFGPFQSGTKIKWVEANGATPSISPMGGNNGNGNGQANAVDYQIRAQGDAEAFVIDENGIETSVKCLVPPFPQ